MGGGSPFFKRLARKDTHILLAVDQIDHLALNLALPSPRKEWTSSVEYCQTYLVVNNDEIRFNLCTQLGGSNDHRSAVYMILLVKLKVLCEVILDRGIPIQESILWLCDL